MIQRKQLATTISVQTLSQILKEVCFSCRLMGEVFPVRKCWEITLEENQVCPPLSSQNSSEIKRQEWGTCWWYYLFQYSIQLTSQLELCICRLDFGFRIVNQVQSTWVKSESECSIVISYLSALEKVFRSGWKEDFQISNKLSTCFIPSTEFCHNCNWVWYRFMARLTKPSTQLLNVLVHS